MTDTANKIRVEPRGPEREEAMFLPTGVILYVSDLAKSSAFYANLFDSKPEFGTPFFTLFKLAHGFDLGLWIKDKVEPDSPATGTSAELGFTAPTVAALNDLHQQWIRKGVPIILAPKKMYFGGTQFVGLDPDGHRLRAATPD